MPPDAVLNSAATLRSACCGRKWSATRVYTAVTAAPIPVASGPDVQVAASANAKAPIPTAVEYLSQPRVRLPSCRRYGDTLPPLRDEVLHSRHRARPVEGDCRYMTEPGPADLTRNGTPRFGDNVPARTPEGRVRMCHPGHGHARQVIMSGPQRSLPRVLCRAVTPLPAMIILFTGVDPH